MMRIVYFIKYLLQGIFVALGMMLAVYIGVTYIWGIPVLIGLMLAGLYLVWCWDKACAEYEEKRGNKSYSHPDVEFLKTQINELKESEDQ